MRTNWAEFIFVYLCFVAMCASSSINTTTCNPRDLRALTGFLDGLDSPILGWENSDCCAWDGVICELVSPVQRDSNMSLRVVRVELGSKRLKGKISKSLSDLHFLKVLNLSSNVLTSYIPMELFELKHLEVLDLSSNDLRGNITIRMNLPSLIYLDMSRNSLYGSINVEMCGFAKKLQVIDLSSNSFTGGIPSTIGNCSSLEALSLGSNFLEGYLHESLFRLPKLRELNLQSNRLYGCLSSALGNLSSLVGLDLSFNGFTGLLPDAFDNLEKLKRFSGRENLFSGSLPPSLSSSRSISFLDLGNNSLTGSILLDCSAMVGLTSLNLASNRFHGTLPANLASCKSLTGLDLSRNNFSGGIPETFKNLTTLSYLALSNCSLQDLSASLIVLQHCKNLSYLLLTTNFIHEVMPADLVLHFYNLKTLVIANCQLTGVVPNWLSGCTKLELLDLSWNRLSGRIPEMIFSNLKFLFYLDLSNNTFSEGIPKGLTKLHSLIYQNNSITSEEPSFGAQIFSKRDSSARPPLQYNHFRSFPPCLDLSSNFLTGPILAEFGNLKGLHVLNLNNNNLSGPIPDALSNMTSLEILDLSHNNLSGTIPPSLVKLSFLSRFSVAYNHLSGSIPNGGQFGTFPVSSFEGNTHLCTTSLTSCLQTEANKQGVQSNADESPEGEEDSIIGLPFAFGAGTGFSIVVSSLFLSGWVFPKDKRKRRVEISWHRMI